MAKSIWEGRTIAAIKSARDQRELSLMGAKRLVEKRCLIDGLIELNTEKVIDPRLAEILLYLIDRLSP